MKVLLTNNFSHWIQGCNTIRIENCYLNNFIEKLSERIKDSRLLRDARVGPGTAAALVEYEIRREQPIIVNINNAKLVCVSLPGNNGELEEHYYFANEKGEWLTENPFLAQYQNWFKNVERMGNYAGDYYAFTAFPVQEYKIEQKTAPCAFLGGRMNWTHWNVDCLSPLLLMSPTEDVCLITSRLLSWQIDSLKFFGYGNYPRIQVSNGEGISIISINTLKFVWKFDQIDRFSILRSNIMRLVGQHNKRTDIELLAPNLEQNTRVRRVANTKELKDMLTSLNSTFVEAAKLSYSDKVDIYGRSKNIVTMPGSESINTLLFAKDNAKIIQMIPWPNNLMNLSRYSLIVAFRQMAYQSAYNIIPYYGTAKWENSHDFNSEYYYSPLELAKHVSDAN